MKFSCILVLKRMTLVGFMKVTFFARTIEHSILTSGRGGYSISQESMSKATKAHNLWEK